HGIRIPRSVDRPVHAFVTGQRDRCGRQAEACAATIIHRMSQSIAPSPASTIAYQADEAFARHLDATDPLRAYRERFHIPKQANGEDVIYLCGNSLGLQPKAARELA